MKKMARGFLPKSFVVLFVFVGWFFGEGLVSIGSASEDIQEETTAEVKELEYEEFLDWLTGLEAKGMISGEEFEDILDRVTTRVEPYTFTRTTYRLCCRRGQTYSLPLAHVRVQAPHPPQQLG